MRSVSWTARISVLTVIVVLLVPSGMAADTPPAVDPSLWEKFVAWLSSRINIPGGVAADEDSFTVWSMGRLDVPGG